MNKMIFLFFIFFTFIFLSCNKESHLTNPNITDMLSIALSKGLIHIQTRSEIRNLRNHKVKAIAEIFEDDKTQKPDSTTFLTFDKNGHITSRTTSECSTMGCLPYDIRQVFIYENDTVKVMNDYSFKYKKKSNIDYWLTRDTSRLRFLYDELYTYKDDTISVDEMPAIAKYIKDKKGRIIQFSLNVKTNDQHSVNYLTYDDSTIFRSAINLQGQKMELVYYYNEERNSIVMKFVNGNINTEWLFDNDGLIKTIVYYNLNGTIKEKKSLHYYFYKS